SGEKIDLIGPSGNGFCISKEHQSIMVVGGGIGTFPLLFLLNESPAIDKKAFLGFREKQVVVLEEEFQKAAGKVFFSTDDGSFGRKGLVSVPLSEEIAVKKPDIIYTCGPMPMIKKVVEIAKENNIKCEVSLEQRMGCGIGACLVCACRTKFGDDWEYSHICSDGPVFDSDKVLFE
ncbi:MAG TPA: dihydroorotate dehydrogenase electron transfer subunit, partial [Clostridia bacterium]